MTFFTYEDNEITQQQRDYAHGFKILNAQTLAGIGKSKDEMPNFRFTKDCGGMSKLPIPNMSQFTIKEANVNRERLLGKNQTLE